MTTWNIDASHTNVGFAVKHMMISKVRGRFTGVEGTIVGNPEELENANITFKIDASTIHTNNNDRDNHLRSADFFEVETYPEITFVSTDIVKTDDGEYNLTGDMTLRGVTKKVTFKTTFEGKNTLPQGVEVVAFEGKTKISRKEFGLTWNPALETGGVLVGDEITIALEVQANPA